MQCTTHRAEAQMPSLSAERGKVRGETFIDSDIEALKAISTDKKNSCLNMLMRFYLHLPIKSSEGPAIVMRKIPVAFYSLLPTPYSLFPVFRQSRPQAVSPKHPPIASDSRPCSRPCRRRRGRVRQRTLRWCRSG